jgi:hypothetical protein
MNNFLRVFKPTIATALKEVERFRSQNSADAIRLPVETIVKLISGLVLELEKTQLELEKTQAELEKTKKVSDDLK